jgi:hypothetical protein
VKRKLVWVQWRDSAIAPLEYLKLGRKPDSITVYESAGFLVDEDDNALTLAIDWQEDTQKWRGIIGIPKENIMKKRIFKLG